MIKNKFFHRNISDRLHSAIKRSPVVLITGARQTGKTTLVKKLCDNKEYTYVTFDDLRFLDRAKKDPIGFISNLKKPLILDEVQRVPEIFLTIKYLVDQDRVPGMFVLTGSADPMLLPKLGDSLAGRIEIINMYPLSQGEILGKKEVFLEHAFSDTINELDDIYSPLEDLCQKMYLGGYPGILKQDKTLDTEQNIYSWFNGYLTTILQRDVKNLSQIEGVEQLPNLLYFIASRTGGLLNISELSRSINLPYTTLNRYLVLLKTLFMIFFLRPWFKNYGKRLVKSPKLYLGDTGLLLYLLQSDFDKLINDQNLLGSIFENFVVCEILKQSSWSDYFIETFHYQTVSRVEVDIVLQNNKGKVVGIEIKSNQYAKESDFKGLKQLKKDIGKNFVSGIVIYTGDKKIPFGGNLWAIPVSCLWH